MACPVCNKGNRAVLYCQRAGCGLRPSSMPDLPRPDVEVTTNSDGKTHVVISRDGKGKSYEIAGTTAKEQIKDAVDQVIGDNYSAEWIPRK